MSETNSEKQENEEDMVESERGDLPVVLQCSQCNVILGDSTSWVSSNDDLNSITLHSVSSMVSKGKQLVTSTEGLDIGSTYQRMQCKSCKEVIGRIYITTPRSLDDLRDLYTLSITKINSYQVGSQEQTSGVEDLLSISTAKELKDSITKAQVMVCTLSERVLNIEKAMMMEGEEREDEEETDDFKQSEDKTNTKQEEDSMLKSSAKSVRGRKMLDQFGQECNETNNVKEDVKTSNGKRLKERDGKYERNSKRTKTK